MKNYKILSIDGGGIKGLYSAVILEKFEEQYGPLYKHFNLICGTSTGGIIALSLAAGIPASEVVKFYVEKGPLIFPYKNKLIRGLQWVKQLLFVTKYSNDQLRAALKDVFKEKRIRDCKTTVLIPSVNITTGKPYVFKSDHAPDLNRDDGRLLTEVALATAAAPTFFPIVEIQTQKGKEQFVDGGLWVNNPALLGIQEFLRYYSKDKGFDHYSLLSVSSLHEHIKFPKPEKVWKRKPFIFWGNNLISMMIDAQSFAVDNHIEFLRAYVDGDYLRIPSMSLTAKEKPYIELDMACPTSLNIMLKKGRRAGDIWLDNERLQKYF